MGNPSNEIIARSVPSQQLEANAIITIQYASIGTQAMEEHNVTRNARKHEQVQNHSLASMATTEIVIIYKTKNISPLLEKGALARHVLGKNRFMPT